MTLLWTLISCMSEENTDLIDAVYLAQVEGEDFLGSEEVRVLQETRAFQSESQFEEIDTYARYLSDDDLNEIEKKSLVDTFGGTTAESKEAYAVRLGKYDWHHAWTRSTMVRWGSSSAPDDEAGARIFKIMQEKVDLSTLSWDEKLAMAETVEGYVIAQYRHKPRSALEAIRAYAVFEPARKSVPRSFIEILQSGTDLEHREELVEAIHSWSASTVNPIVAEKFLNILGEMRIASQNPTPDFLECLGVVTKPQDLPAVLAKILPDEAGILAQTWAGTHQAAAYAKAWSESDTNLALPASLQAVFDSEVRDQEVAEKRVRILSESSNVETPSKGGAAATITLKPLQSEIENASDAEFSLWLAAINSILVETPGAFSSQNLSFLKPKILAATDSRVVAEAKTLFTHRADLIGASDFLILAYTLAPQEIAAHDYSDKIIAVLKEDTTPKSFEVFVRCALQGLSPVTWDEVYTKAARTKTFTSESLLKDLITSSPKSKAFWQKLADENVLVSAQVIQTLSRLDEQKAFAGILIASKKAETYRSSAKTWRIPTEVKNLFLDPLAELRGKVPAALLDQMVLIKAGSFTMGSPDGAGENDEHPQHSVAITQNFYACKFEITNAIWKEVMGTDPSAQYGAEFTGADHPVVGVSWNEVQQFFTKLNEKPGPGARLKFRLPTEAEWEYMARAGTTTAFPWGEDEMQIGRYGNIEGANDGYSQTAPVGRFEKNAFGLYDMIGNVWEWTEDGYGNYSASSVRDPIGTGDRKVIRGGSWNYYARYARSANRSGYEPDIRSHYIGFRVVIQPQHSSTNTGQ